MLLTSDPFPDRIHIDPHAGQFFFRFDEIGIEPPLQGAPKKVGRVFEVVVCFECGQQYIGGGSKSQMNRRFRSVTVGCEAVEGVVAVGPGGRVFSCLGGEEFGEEDAIKVEKKAC